MIRVINVRTFEFEEFPNESEVFGKYAILSHRWSGDEVSFQKMNDGGFRKRLAGRFERMLHSIHHGFKKIKATCRLAREVYGLQYVWIDSCCINQDDIYEKQASINSMFRWYQNASVCIVHLFNHEDSHNFPTRESLPPDNWFKRGWTLQELLAPRKVHFYSANWHLIGSKNDYAAEIKDITGIPEAAITNKCRLDSYSVAQRMSWAAERETTHGEDMAYCLLGIFDIVDMQKLYGLGAVEAFRLLLKKIIERTNDMSIFGWSDFEYSQSAENYNLLARSPKAFARCGDFGNISKEWHRTKIEQGRLEITGTARLRFVNIPSSLDPSKGDFPYWDASPTCWTQSLAAGVDSLPRYVLFVSAVEGTAVGIVLERETKGSFKRDMKRPLVRMDGVNAEFVQFDKYSIPIDNGTALPTSTGLNFHRGFRRHPQVRIKDAWPSSCWDHANCKLFEPDYFSQFCTLSIEVQLKPEKSPVSKHLALEVLCSHRNSRTWTCLLLDPEKSPDAKKALDDLRVDQREKKWDEFVRKAEEVASLTNSTWTTWLGTTYSIHISIQPNLAGGYMAQIHVDTVPSVPIRYSSELSVRSEHSSRQSMNLDPLQLSPPRRPISAREDAFMLTAKVS
ncbi:HET-domain-containing protein [Hypoxylon sp. FL1857]|nr:HET-domain-containing protein [Hypoxylon sp. FL1857]